MSGTAHVRSGNNECAYVHSPGKTPGVFFLGGFNSSMQGLKALALEVHCRNRGIEFTRFDYSGHGQSGGVFTDGCISDWLDDALTVFDHVSASAKVIVGSSMGSWIGTLLALERTSRVAALMGIASALDFTRDLMDRHLNDTQRADILSVGITHVPSCYDDEAPYPITRKLIDDGEKHSLLDANIEIDAPVHLLHGMCDQDINWQTSIKFAQRLRGRNTLVTLIKDGDHRLSSERHLATLIQALDELYESVGGVS